MQGDSRNKNRKIADRIVSNRAGIAIAGESNSGLVRKHNEDSFCVICRPDRDAVLAVVADGVGGHCHGEIASLICCRDLARGFLDASAGNPDSPYAADKFLRDSMREINRKIFQRNYCEQQARPMASTLIAVIFFRDTLVMGAAGDSRLYELDAGRRLRQLSVDHTLSAEYIREYGRDLSGRNVAYGGMIARAVGPRSELELEVRHFPRGSGSRYLLCSDGVYRCVPAERMAEELGKAATPRAAVDGLMRAALLGGGRDNITAVVAFPEREER